MLYVMQTKLANKYGLSDMLCISWSESTSQGSGALTKKKGLSLQDWSTEIAQSLEK